MSNILETNFLEQDWVKEQPDDFKNQLLENFREQYNGNIDYIDYLGEPVIFSKKDNSYYIYKEGKLQNTGNDISENDLDVITLEKFNSRFNNIGTKIGEDFSTKARIENSIMMILLSNKNPEVYLWIKLLIKNNGLVNGIGSIYISGILDVYFNKNNIDLNVDDLINYFQNPIDEINPEIKQRLQELEKIKGLKIGIISGEEKK